GFIEGFPKWVRVSVGEARSMLTAISTATLTATSVAFSLVMVVVVQTANAYSPRLLRDYLSDARNQNALGAMTGTFVFSLIVLRSLGTTPWGVPVVAVNAALLLTLYSTLVLVL